MKEEGIFFTSPEHRRRWLLVMLAMGKVYEKKLDQEYGAALYILASSAGIWQKAESYIEPDEGIHFESMLAEVHFASGDYRLIQLAWNLFDYTRKTDLSPVDLITYLGNQHFTVALTALQIRKVSLRLEDLSYTEEEIRHARELAEMGATEITGLVAKMLEDEA